ncbi:hypothetical protein [Bradyrhizobium sp.]|uniref:hypothetical protein n=1 Tax=Bradyrhizobium sp. TaxID=376 RepID=UPI002D3DB270|nr:hypothetical protein [Bradyrhizobium sp.]HZR71299.1 hypothetical protein [Bradyrhizobium sp.]
MSRLIMGISGALALSLVSGAAISGAAGFARGRDQSPIAGSSTPTTQGLSLSASAEGAPSVNRGSKADRTAAVVGSPASSRTISLQLEAFSDTTFLVRIPAANSNAPARPAAVRRLMVACEPVVSVLTEVAKRLQPGRCVA